MHEGNNRTSIRPPYVEPSATGSALHPHENPAFNTPVSIHVISYRKYRHDTDGISVKAVFDGLVEAGILTGDTSEHIKKVTFESRKSKDERTVIEIEEIGVAITADET